MVTTSVVAIITGGSVAVWLESKFHAQTSNLLSAIFAVGGSEEFAKLLAVVATLAVAAKLWPARRAELFEASPKSFLYLGAISGVVFGCAEGVEYIVNSQQVTFNGHDNGVGLTQMIFLRLISDPINHAMWAAITGFFVGLAVQRARRANRMTLSGMLEQSWLIGIGLAMTATLHGLHDFFSNTGLVDVIIDVTSVLLMLGYALAGDVVEKALADAPIRIRGTTARTSQPAQPVPAPQWAPPPAGYYAPPQYGPPAQPPAQPVPVYASSVQPVSSAQWAPTVQVPTSPTTAGIGADGYGASRP
jgi:RsiW-degrading membrane proteinase PrsW (M82 family)